MYQILVVDDDESIVSIVKTALEREGYAVISAADGAQACHMVQRTRPHLVIMDVMMPKVNGLLATMRIRENSNIPILMLSAKAEGSDRVLGLEAGADDYLVKPFYQQELLARVRALLRRNKNYLSDVLTCGNLKLDATAYELFTSFGKVRLSSKEYQLMSCFMRNPHHIFPAEELMEKIWGWDTSTETNVVWTYITYLRRKLEYLKASVQIQSIRSVGYHIVEKK